MNKKRLVTRLCVGVGIGSMLLAGSCSKKKSSSSVVAEVPPELAMTAAEQTAAESTITAWRARARPRPPLLRPPATPRECRAGDRYRAAIELFVPHRESLALDRMLWQPARWSELDPAVAEILASPFATAVAEAVLAGAACRDGSAGRASPPEGESDLEVLPLAQTTTMIALKWADDGQALDAGYLLLAVMQMGYDLARPGDLLHQAVGWVVAGYPIEALDQVATRLDAAGLDEIAEVYRLVIDSAPSYLDILRGERMAATALMLWYAQGGAKGPQQDERYRELVADLGTVGNVVGYLERFDRLIDGLARIEGLPLPAGLALVGQATAAVTWPNSFFDPARFLTQHRVGLAVARAHQIALAVRAEKSRTGNWPADLGFLGDLATDPRTGEPFDYVAEKHIHGGPVDCGAQHEAGCDAITVALE